jgi:DnaJ-class molecular chaperone
MNDAHDRKRSAAKPTRKPPSSTGHDDDGEDSAAEGHEPRVCMPCHGTGKIISNLGGHPRKVTCPWCRGGGERLTGADAQEWQQEQVALKH